MKSSGNLLKRAHKKIERLSTTLFFREENQMSRVRKQKIMNWSSWFN